MQARKQTIIGISPGTRSLGFAVLRQGKLISWNVKTFNFKWNKEKAKHILSTLHNIVKYHEPSVIVIKRVDPIRS